MSDQPATDGTPAGTDAQSEDTPTPSASDAPAPAPKRSGAKTTRERAEEKRQEKLDFVREQQESGSLVIRQMTDEERSKYPVRPKPPPRRPR